MVANPCPFPGEAYLRTWRLREDRLRTFVEGQHFDPRTHSLYATAEHAGGGRPREVISIVPRADEDVLAPGREAAWMKDHYPSMVVPAECDAFALLELD